MKAFKFNTSIATLMEYSTELLRGYDNFQISKNLWKSSIERLLLHLAPLAPHIAEELWQITGNDFSIHQQSLPKYDDALIIKDTLTIVLQVNGKVRDTLNIPSPLNEDKVKDLALRSENVKKYIENKQILKSIYVKNKLLNLVVK
jgi:leucyl-tRNA synthetase